MTPVARPLTPSGQCRRCNCFCDKVIEPAACVAAGCPFLYAYDDEPTGRRYLGCLHKVFKAEVDAEELEANAHRGRAFGALRATGRPLPFCPSSIEQAFSGVGSAYQCVNHEFWAAEEPAELDLRDWA